MIIQYEYAVEYNFRLNFFALENGLLYLFYGFLEDYFIISFTGENLNNGSDQIF
jgi:hypothetical protein